MPIAFSPRVVVFRFRFPGSTASLRIGVLGLCLLLPVWVAHRAHAGIRAVSPLGVSAVSVGEADALAECEQCRVAASSESFDAGWLFDTSGFPRRWNCGTWSDFLGWLHIGSDLAIWAAYMAIPLILGFFVYKRRTPLPGVTWLFIAFIGTCGIVHLMEAIIFYQPIYRLAGVWKLVTAVVSWAAVLALLPVIPKVLAWPTAHEMNEKLRAEMRERVAAEHRLEEANLKLRQAVQELDMQRKALDEHAIVAITDRAGVITYVNDKFCEISGFDREELIGQTHRVINSGRHDRGFFTRMWQTITSGEVWHGEICNCAKDKSLYWVDTTIVPFTNEQGEITQYVAIRADTTERKLMMQRQSEVNEQLRGLKETLEKKNAEMEQFVYSVSHDLKSPIVTQIGYVGCLKEDLAEGNYGQAADSVSRIEKATDRLRACVDDLLELARIGRTNTERTPVAIGPLLKDLRDDLAGVMSRRHVELTIDTPMPTVQANPVRLAEVFENLVNNAVKYGCAESGGRIHIGCEEEGGEVRLYVRDHGPGIPEAYHDKVFGLFQRLEPNKAEGTGIGLAIVKRIMDEHGGRVWIESTQGQGATFWLAFEKAL